MKKVAIVVLALSFLLMAGSVQAIQLGNNFNLDIQGFVGRTANAEYEVQGDTEVLQFTGTLDEWDMQAEVGVTAYNTIRIFGKYKTVTGLFNEEGIGVDLNSLGLLGVKGNNSIGIRTMYTHRHDYAIGDKPKTRSDLVSAGAYIWFP